MFDKKLALDYIESGKSLEEYEYSKEIPDGVTKKKIYEDAVRIAWPSFVELTLTQLTSMVDLMMVGQLGSWAITSVGLTNQPKMIMMAVFTALNVGATALVAMYKGSGQQKKANDVLRQSLYFTLVVSGIAAFLGFYYASDLIRFMGAAEELTQVNGTIYLKIQAIGIVFLALTSTITAALRGAGDSKIAMQYNVTANVINVIFNYLLIGGNFGFPTLGVAGASLATIIGQFVALLLAIRAITKAGGYLFIYDIFKVHIDFDIIYNVVKIGIPAMIEQLFMRVGMLIYTTTVSSLGTVAFATHNICLNIQSLTFMIGQGFAVSATSLVGQSIGKKRVDMAKHYSKSIQFLGLFVSLILAVIFMMFGSEFIGLYSKESEVISQGTIILLFIGLMQPLQTAQSITTGILRGAGDTKTTAVIMFFTILIIRPVFAIVTIHYLHWGLYGAWIAMFSDQIIRTTCIMARYLKGKWYNIKLKGI